MHVDQAVADMGMHAETSDAGRTIGTFAFQKLDQPSDVTLRAFHDAVFINRHRRENGFSIGSR